jgi:hypothetical protein
VWRARERHRVQASLRIREQVELESAHALVLELLRKPRVAVLQERVVVARRGDELVVGGPASAPPFSGIYEGFTAWQRR